MQTNQTKNQLSKYKVLDETFYKEVTNIITDSRKSVYNFVNSELVVTNWKIGKMIDEKQKSLPRAEYGEKLIKELSSQMTKDFGEGYSEKNLFRMRKFRKTFKTVATLSPQLSWSHYKYLIKVSRRFLFSAFY